MRRSRGVALVVVPVVLGGCSPSAPAAAMHCIDPATQQVAIDDYCTTPTTLHPGYMWYYGGSLYNGGLLRGGSYSADPALHYVNGARSVEVLPGSGGARVTPVRGGFGSVGSGHGGGEGE